MINMKTAEWLNMEIFKAIGWTIIHSLWQVLLLFALFKFLLLMINKNNPTLRYYSGIGLLVVSLVWSVFTFNREYNSFSKTDAGTAVHMAVPAVHNSQPLVAGEKNRLGGISTI